MSSKAFDRFMREACEIEKVPREVARDLWRLYGDRWPCVHGVNYLGTYCGRCGAWFDSHPNETVPADATPDLGRVELWDAWKESQGRTR